MAYTELFGSPAHRALLRRGEDVWRVVQAHPRYAYYGTVVSLSDPGDDTAEIMASLARLQGIGMCFYYPKNDVAALLGDLEAKGLRTAQSWFHRGGQAAYEASKALLHGSPPPEHLTITRLDGSTPNSLIKATIELCQKCGLSSMPGEVMRGRVIPGVNFVATDSSGVPVATAGSYAMHAPHTPRATEAFWGVLATREDHRGQGLAARLGAMAIEHMWETKGMRAFNTGIKPENLASQAACAKLGVLNTEWVTAFCYDDARLAD
ncbi:GNAT family N-acetyltransferase [Rhodobacterales bacterium HKCCE3408]|nr:GNAT family N-acetyltransferase [Rhodobacterales bacterium HKCCE3408]